MSRIFLSHSSADEFEAVAIKQWLMDNGWDDVFLDIDPLRGLAAGERWQEALRRAADRCEAVLFVVSPAWAKSKWCLTEFLLAKSLHKLIFGIVLKDVPIGELPTEMTAEWQLSHLTGQGTTETIQFTHRGKPAGIAFLADGLTRLRSGLQGAGLKADFFPWPPKADEARSPYRGLEPLDAEDAAVFLGRDTEILQGLDRLRGMRAAGDQGLFVILGASGAGKSSFLRAGLLPRLARDDRHFFPLEAIRPERNPLNGERGLASSLSKANRRLQITPVNPGELKSALNEGPERFSALLRNIRNAVQARIIDLPDDAPPPTIILPVDQAEELFSADATEETHGLLDLIGTVLRNALTNQSERHMPIIVVFTIRSDRYERLQTAPELVGLKTVLFDALRPMPPAQFKEVITGPATRALVNGKQLHVQPELVSQLLKDCAQGGDALPLLGLTMARLYRVYGTDGDLQLKEYLDMGGMADVITTEAESVLSIDPHTRSDQLTLLHAAFIPSLATINTENEQPMRRVARMPDLPKDSRPLIHALIDKRLLLSDLRDGEQIVEVAHESLLRQWKVLADWLDNERDDLKEADRLEQDAKAWVRNGKKVDWLREGERLDIGEALAAKPTYQRRLETVREFLLAARQREEQRRAGAERQRQAELVAAQDKQAAAEALAAEQQRATQRARADAARLKKFGQVIGVLLFFAVIAVVGFYFSNRDAVAAKQDAVRARTKAQANEKDAQMAQHRAEDLLGFLLGEQFLEKIRDVGRSSMLEQVERKVRSYANDPDPKMALMRGLALRNAGDLERMRGNTKESLVFFGQALEAIEGSPETPDRDRETARTRERIGEVLVEQGHVSQALERYTTAVKDWRQVVASAEVEVSDCTSLADSLVSSGELNRRMGQATLASRDLDRALTIITTVPFGHCRSMASAAESYPDAKALEVLSRVMLLRANILNFKEDYEGAVRLASEAKMLKPGSTSATIQKASALALLANSKGDTPQHALQDYRLVLAEFDELRRRDPTNRLWEREQAAVQLLIAEGIVACRQNKVKNCKPMPLLGEAEITSLQATITLRELTKSNPSNVSWQRDLGWAQQVRAKVLAAETRSAESLEVLRESERSYNATILDRSDADLVWSLGSTLLSQAWALADLKNWPEAKATLQRVVTLFEQFEKERGAQGDNLIILGYLWNARTEEVKFLQKAGDKKGADLAEQKRKRLEEQYNNLHRALSEHNEQETTKLNDSYIASVNQGAKLFKAENYAAALHEFNAAEAAMREYIGLKPTAFKGYDNLRNINDWIQLTQEKLGNLKDAAAARNVTADMASLSTLLYPEHDAQPVDDNLRLARRRVGQSYYNSKRFEEALTSVQQEIAAAETIVKKDPQNAQHLSDLSNAHFGQGMVRRDGDKAGWEEAIRIGIAYMEKAADVDKKHPQYLNELGMYRKYLADEFEADSLNEKALVEYRLAVKAYKEAVRRSPRDETALKGIEDLAKLEIR